MLILENNRPLIRGRYQLKHRRIDWKVIEGPNMGSGSLNQIIQAIENPAAKRKDEGPQNGLTKTSHSRKQKPENNTSLGERKL